MEWCKRHVKAHNDALSWQQLFSWANGIDKCLKENDLDILVVPSDATKATRISAMAGTEPQETHDDRTLKSHAGGADKATGYPIANIPIGVQENGLPFGVAIFASRFREDQLLQAMSAFEILFPGVAKPKQFEKDASWPLLKASNL